MKTFKKFIPLIIIAALILVVILTPLRNYFTPEFVTGLITNIQGSPLSYLIFCLLYIVAVILVVPGLPLTLLAAPLFGFWQGLLLVVIASNIGCTITFFISRFAGKNFVMKIIKSGSILDKANKQMEKNGFLYMLYLRAIPLFPFNIVNYVPGLTSVSYPKYALATFIGMLPGSAIYVYASFTAADLQNNPWGLIISISILVLFTVVTLLISKHNSKKEKSEMADKIVEDKKTAVI